eukprot:scaffold2058_cov115-Cylindrotheca_fusiformis.AAC.16
MEFGMEWDAIIERQYEASRAAADALLLQASKNTTKANGDTTKSRISTAALLSPLAIIVSLPVGIYYLIQALQQQQQEKEHQRRCLIQYEGTCHCQSVRFEMVAPKELSVETSTEMNPYNDVMYRYTNISTSNFEITQGKDDLKTYYVAEPTSFGSTTISSMPLISRKRKDHRASGKGARSFCKRCGVHILYAPRKNSPTMQINITCVTIPPLKEEEEEETAAAALVVAKEEYDIPRRIARTVLILARAGQDILKRGSDNVVNNSPIANSLMEAARKLLLLLKPLSGGQESNGTNSNSRNASYGNGMERTVASSDAALSSRVRSLSTASSITHSSIDEKRKKKRELEARQRSTSDAASSSISHSSISNSTTSSRASTTTTTSNSSPDKKKKKQPPRIFVRQQ